MRRILWIMASGLILLTLLTAACGPAVVEEKKQSAPTAQERPSAPVVEEKKQEVVTEKQEVVKLAPEGPKYGGTITWSLSADIRGFDEGVGTTTHSSALTNKLTNEDLLQGDWTKGPPGTGEATWWLKNNRLDHKGGNLAESWQMPEPGHWILKIRQGIHYALNPAPFAEASRLVAGREYTASDAEFNLRRMVTSPTTYIYLNFPVLRNPEFIKAVDKWTLDIKVPMEGAFSAADMFLDYAVSDYPPEVIKKYGDMGNWRNSAGTGAFMLSDYVPGGTVSFVRNPNYFKRDPIGPGKGNQLPYVDSVKYLIIPDASTRLAALRTAKLDELEVPFESVKDMQKTSPQLLNHRYPTQGSELVAAMRIDKPPYNDIRVRHALTMAIDFDTIIASLTNGEAAKLNYPGVGDEAYPEAMLKWEEAPPEVQELYSYNPERAKQLLKEAGYPNGFKTSIVTLATAADNLAILKNYWSKIGVELAFDVKETGAYNTIRDTHNYQDMATGGGGGTGTTRIRGTHVTGGGYPNLSGIDDSTANEAVAKIGRVMLTNPIEAMTTYKNLMKHVYYQAWTVSFPTRGANYLFWWPWLKNFYGESVGYINQPNFSVYAWIDQDLKKKMGY